MSGGGDVEDPVEQFVTDRLDDSDGRCWSLYERAFDDLRHLAVQRHLMVRAEFDELMQDKRVTKYLVRDEDRVAALATLTNDLDAVHLISPEYFQRHYPELYEQRRIWYVGFAAADPDYQGSRAMSRLIERLCEDVRGAEGMFVLDICDHKSRRLLAAGIERMAGTHLTGLTRERLDAQVYWGYRFPEAAESA